MVRVFGFMRVHAGDLGLSLVGSALARRALRRSSCCRRCRAPARRSSCSARRPHRPMSIRRCAIHDAVRSRSASAILRPRRRSGALVDAVAVDHRLGRARLSRRRKGRCDPQRSTSVAACRRRWSSAAASSATHSAPARAARTVPETPQAVRQQAGSRRHRERPGTAATDGDRSAAPRLGHNRRARQRGRSRNDRLTPPWPPCRQLCRQLTPTTIRRAGHASGNGAVL